MIISKTICLSIKHLRNLNFYQENNCKIIDDFIIIPIDLIPITSHIKILVKCDFCEKEHENTYIKYNTSIKKGGYYSCSKECAKEKRKLTNLEKYGGSGFGSSKLADKIKKTNLEKHGVENATQYEEVKIKRKKSNLENHGVENVFQSKEIKNKIKNTNLENHGVEWYTQTNDFIEKVKKTNLKNYGVEWYIQTNNYRESYKKTCLEKYGVSHITQSEEIRKNYNIANDPNYIRYNLNEVSILKCDCNQNHLFEIKTDNYFSRKKQNIPLCTVCYPIGDQKSIREIELFNFIKSIYNGEMTQNYRDGLEIDIYLPELKLGFEFNGLHWHSEKYRDKDYHLYKLNYFKEKDINVIFIWEDDWLYKREIVKSIIRNKLNKINNKIFARNCKVKEIKDNKVIKEFLNNNHIQGFVGSSIKIGLYYNDELVSLMTFDKFEGRKKMTEGEWNLSRFCNKLNISIIGGASKLLKYFIKNYKPLRMVSYADKDWSSGDLYYKLGFNKLYETKPDYKYLINSKRIHKSRYRKSNILNLGNINESEKSIMEKNNMYRIYDCGKVKFQLII